MDMDFYIEKIIKYTTEINGETKQNKTKQLTPKSITAKFHYLRDKGEP